MPANKPPKKPMSKSKERMFEKLKSGKLKPYKGKDKRFFERNIARVLFEHPKMLERHQKCVKKVAVSIAVQLKKLEKTVDVNLIDTAARFHDIARELEGFIAYKSNIFVGHENLGADILENFGLSAEAALVRSHFVERIVNPLTLSENHLPLEQKILIYADARSANGKTVPLEERRQYILDRSGKYTDENIHAIYGSYGISTRDQHIRVVNAVYDILERWESEWRTMGVKIP